VAERITENAVGDDGAYDVEFVDEAKVASVARAPEPEGVPGHPAETFRALSDPTRVKILSALVGEGLCVCDLATLPGITSSALPHQLRALRNLRLVKFRRDGTSAYYSLDERHVGTLLGDGMEHVKERE